MWWRGGGRGEERRGGVKRPTMLVVGAEPYYAWGIVRPHKSHHW